MSNYDFIYGSKVLIQCQAQINMHPWNCGKQHEVSAKYLILIKKEASFFTHWCQTRHVVKCIVSESPEEHLDKEVLDNVGTKIDDRLITRERAISWSKVRGDVHPVSHSGHGKQMIILKEPTFCAKDMGISFNPHNYSYSVSR
ncbi:MAG: hypothetical protein Q8N79_07625 [Candidatus Methanoperedens sp.]|nr:hypothetical protein [Candidatus Methanoperedens sp.]